MVTTQDAGSSAAASEVSGQTFNKLKQIGSDLMTATGNGKLINYFFIFLIFGVILFNLS